MSDLKIDLRHLLRVSECARVANCHEVTIRRAIEYGQLRALRLGPKGSYRVPRESLDAWMRPAHDHKETTSDSLTH